MSQFAEADAALAASITGYIGTGAFYRAMRLFRQGKPDEARQLAAAAAQMEPVPNDEKGPLADNAGHDTLILWLAYKEAKELIGFDATPNVPIKPSNPPGSWSRASKDPLMRNGSRSVNSYD